MQGTSIIKATTIGNKTVQQKDINWSKRILGKLALAQINIKIIMDDLIPKTTADITPDEVFPIIKLGIDIDSVSGKLVTTNRNENKILSFSKDNEFLYSIQLFCKLSRISLRGFCKGLMILTI
jgi:hypothetical protein